MGEFESGLGQGDLSLPNDKGQDLIVTQVPVGLRSKLKQLPYNHTQRPGKIHRWRVRRCFLRCALPETLSLKIYKYQIMKCYFVYAARASVLVLR